MADVPFYAQGSQLANTGLFQQQPLTSSIPSIGGQQGYVPGYGMAPYSQQPAVNPQMAMAQQILSSPSASPENKMWAQNLMNTQGGGTLSTMPSTGTAGAAPGTAAVGGSGFTTIGQGEAWMSPSELAAQTDALKSKVSSTPSGGGGGGGGGGGSSGSAAAAEGAAGGLFGAGASMPSEMAGYNTPNFTPQQAVASQPITYAAPGNIGYQAPTQGGQQAAGQGTLAMQQPNGQNALNAYLNTPGQMLLGQGAGQYYQQSPGYQYAMDQALGQVQNQASARGLLESGAVLRDMTKTAQGMASQDYNNWWNQQAQLYGDYQNRLQGLAGGDTGANNAMTLGQNLGANAQATASNLGSLFGNQATSGLGAYANTGAAQAANMNQAANTQLQTNSANTSSLLAGAMLNKGKF